MERERYAGKVAFVSAFNKKYEAVNANQKDQFGFGGIKRLSDAYSKEKREQTDGLHRLSPFAGGKCQISNFLADDLAEIQSFISKASKNLNFSRSDMNIGSISH